MTNKEAFTLTDSQNGNLALKIFSFDDARHFDFVQRNNFYSLIWVKDGIGTIKADFSEYSLQNDTLFAFSPYQPFMFKAEKLQGIAINFHADFFCIHEYNNEINANGVLFNNVYKPPYVFVTEQTAAMFNMLVTQLKTEIQNKAIAQKVLLVSYLKIFLIAAVRLKIEQQPLAEQAVADLKEIFILNQLKNAIEKDYKTKHSASDYTEDLSISAKSLAKLIKIHFNKTLTDLIAERIIIEAKRELYLTDKTIKEIAYELGYIDEYYFSRFFKLNTDVSPKLYRESVGFARGAII